MHVSDLHNRTRQWLRGKLYQDYCMHLRMCYVFMTQNGACLCSTFGQRSLCGGGGGEQHGRVQNYKRVSACGILCQGTMLDDKILLKCEGGGLGYEMPNGFPRLCSLHVVFIASLELRPSVLILTVKHFSLLSDIKCWHRGIQNGILDGVCLELPTPSAFPHARGWCW